MTAGPETSGWGPIYRAASPGEESAYDILVLDDVRFGDDEARGESRERCLSAWERLRALNDPSIVAGHEILEEAGRVALAFPASSGNTLLKAAGDSSPWRVVQWIARFSEQLELAHGAGVVHGAIDAAFLRVDPEGRTEVAGWGVAPVASGHAQSIPLARARLTAPEQLRGSEGSVAASDQFALAALAFELLSGTTPFPGDSVASVSYRVLHEPPGGIDRLTAAVGERGAKVILRALEKKPEDRHADVGSFGRALLATAETAQSEGAGPSVARPRSAGGRRRRPGRLLVPLALVALVVVAGYWLQGREEFRSWLADLGQEPIVTPVSPEPTPQANPKTEPEPEPEPEPQAEPTWLETRVVREPLTAEVTLDGVPLDLDARPVVRFSSRAPHGVLEAREGCREISHELKPGDVGKTITLALPPSQVEITLDPGVESGRVRVNGSNVEAGGPTTFDLCRKNTVAFGAAGYRPAEAVLPAGVTPSEARNLVSALVLERIPKGWLELVAPKGLELAFWVDGRRLDKGTRRLELDEGEYEVRARNGYHWIDVRGKARVVGGETVRPDWRLPELADLVVQAFPPNCKVYLRRPGGSWEYIDETPARRRIALGTYQVKVELNPTGETKVRDVELTDGENPPVRVSFARGRS